MSKVNFIAVGDISLQYQGSRNPFEKVEAIFKGKDILFGNLETVLSNIGEGMEKSVLLNSHPNEARHLVEAGFDIVNIANNHILDLGVRGFNETLRVLHDNNLMFIGGANENFKRSYSILNKNGIRILFLGYCTTGIDKKENDISLNKINRNNILTDIKNAKSKSDLIIVSLHWGIENVFYPSPDQIKLARDIIDAGASLILGHHPHVLQGIEKYKNGLIVYSLGNFQFHPYYEKNKISIILSVEIENNKIADYHVIPTRINREYVPFLLDPQESAKIRSFINSISMPVIKGAISKTWWFEKISQEYLVGNFRSWLIRIKKYGIRHLFMCLKWMISPFTIQCYFGFLRQIIKNNEQRIY